MRAALAAAPASSGARPFRYKPPPHLQEVIKLGAFVSANKKPLQQALLKATADTKTSLAALAPLLAKPADVAAIRKFLDVLLAGGTLPPAATTTVLPTPWPPPKQKP
jgi:hypothetical protein